MTTDYTDLPDGLARLGTALHAATTEDVAREHAVAATVDRRHAEAERGRRRTTRRSRRGTVLGVLAGVVIVPSVAVAAVTLISGSEVAASLPAGAKALMDSDPTCTVVRENVEYTCTLAKLPQGDMGAGHWKGVVEPTVDPTKHVNGGCRSDNAAGTKWHCYIGQEAVDQQIIGQQFLGQGNVNPGVG